MFALLYRLGLLLSLSSRSYEVGGRNRASPMRYRLRTLLIVLAVGPMVLAFSVPHVKSIAEDYWLLKYGKLEDQIARYIVVSGGPLPPPKPRGVHPVAEFLARITP
jgi:hypothetical protein